LTKLVSKAVIMTPQDMPGPLVKIESLFPWLAAITPAPEPARPKPEPKPEPLRDAA
jgi:hypothetical protein